MQVSFEDGRNRTQHFPVYVGNPIHQANQNSTVVEAESALQYRGYLGLAAIQCVRHWCGLWFHRWYEYALLPPFQGSGAACLPGRDRSRAAMRRLFCGHTRQSSGHISIPLAFPSA